MLQAMNTGHEGSLSTVHANSPRDALSRLETMVLMAGYELPLRAIRSHVSSALDLVIQLDRLDDGSRRVVEISEVQRMEGEVITLQKLFEFKIDRFEAERRIVGRLHPTGLRPSFLVKFERHGIELPLSLFGGAASAIFGASAAALPSGSTGRRPMRLASHPRRPRGRRSRSRCAGAAAPAATPAEVQVAPVTRLPFPERGYVVSLPRPRVARPGSVVCGRTASGSRRRVDPLAGSGLRFGVVLALDASESMTGGPRGRGARGRRARSSRIARRPRRSGSSPSTARSRSCSAPDRATAPRSGARSRRSRRSPTERGSTTRSRGRSRSCATRRLSSGSIVLLSDGADIGSLRRSTQAVAAAKEQQVRVFTVGLRSGAFDPRRSGRSRERTGGTYAEARSAAELAADLRRPRHAARGRVPRPLPLRRAPDVAGRRSDRGRRARERRPRPTSRRRRRCCAPYHRSLVSTFLLSGSSPLVLAPVLRAARMRAAAPARAASEDDGRRPRRALLERRRAASRAESAAAVALRAATRNRYATAGGRSSSATSSSRG